MVQKTCSHYRQVSMVFVEHRAQNDSHKHSYSGIIFLQIEMGLMLTCSLNQDGCTVPDVESQAFTPNIMHGLFGY